MIAPVSHRGPRADGSSRKRMRGISLIEMLVALLVLSFGLLGLAGLQANSLRNNTSAFYRTQANALAFDIMDRMRGNKNLALANGYDIGIGAAASSPSGTVNTADKIRTLDLHEWKRVLRLLPSGDGSVSCASATRVCVVTVQWDDTRGVGAAQQFVLSAEL
jgi:type IV pilus assembly protein PilV